MAGGIQEGDGLTVDIHGVSTDVLGNAAGLSGGHVGLADSVQQAGLAVVNVAHNHHNGASGLELLGGVHMVVDNPLLDGDGDFLLHLAAHFRSHKLGGVKVDGLVDGSHHAVLHKQLDDLAGGLFHPAGKLAHGNLLRNLHGDRRLPGHLHLETAHLLLLLVSGFVALELVVLLALLLGLAAANALLAAGVVLHPLGNQAVHPVVKTGGVYLHRRGVHHPALPLPFRLLGLGRLRRLLLGLLLLGLGSLRRLLLLGGSLGLGLEHLLQRGNLVVAGHVVKHHIQLLLRQHLGVGLGLFIILGDDLRNFLGGNGKIRRHLLQTILKHTHTRTSKITSSYALFPYAHSASGPSAPASAGQGAAPGLPGLLAPAGGPPAGSGPAERTGPKPGR